MLKICVLLIFILSFINTNATYYSRRPRDRARFGASDSGCTLPTLLHGRARLRQRGRLVKFWCLPGYRLVGNRYSSCVQGEWDEPAPVCIKSGCNITQLENGIQWRLHDDAWLVSFCLPGFDLVGSSTIYCDGNKWNGTFPTCVDSKAPPELSCDFEKDLCGWTDDELHDFDWRRLNKRTPSSFLRTGPSFDHTFGEGQSGYYMYIESTSRMENETARLVSPVYSAALSNDSCFSFFYHMFGKTIGGLKVYQKPERLSIRDFLTLLDSDKQKYTLFEKWGNQGDFWFRDVSKLNNFNDSFQIIIEGIRGSSFTSDIAIDDVAILQGDACKVLTSTTPPPPMDSCQGRCDLGSFSLDQESLSKSSDQCGCSGICLYEDNCCPDFFEICVFTGSTDQESSDNGASSQELPQTQKLVAANTTTALIPTTSTTSTSTTTSTTKTSTTTSTTTKPPTKPPTTSTTKRATKTTTTSVKPTTTKLETPTIKPEIKTTLKVRKISTKPPDATTKATSRVKTTKVVITTSVPKITSKYNDRMKHDKELSIEHKGSETVVAKISAGTPRNSPNSGLKTSAITITVLLLCACVILVAARYRGARGRQALARLRGRITADSEVRYLSADVDD